MSVYQRVRDLREDNDLKQGEVAAKLYLAREVYRRYETGAREIPLNIAILLADFYGVSLDYLAGRTNVKSVNKYPSFLEHGTENKKSCSRNSARIEAIF